MINVYDQVKAERDYQNKKWGQEHDDLNEEAHWYKLILKRVHKLVSLPGVDHSKSRHYRVLLTEVAALVVAAAEAYDRKYEQ